jgi:hypothetical protein
VESHIARVNEALSKLQGNLEVLIDSIVNARKGILQPQVVSPGLPMVDLTRSIPSFPKDRIAPFPLSKDSTNLLHRICDVHVYLSDGILGYMVTLPLLSVPRNFSRGRGVIPSLAERGGGAVLAAYVSVGTTSLECSGVVVTGFCRPSLQ